jgi:tetratricopeptide (TPR) repeat protein
VQGFGAQIAFVRREQGRFDEVLAAVEGFAAQHAGLPAWRAGLAFIYSELGRAAEARRELEALRSLSMLPRDATWLLMVAQLAEVVAFLGDTTRATQLYQLVEPFGDRCIVHLNVISWGSVERSLGVLASTASRFGAAAGHFEAALEINSKLGAALWLAHTHHDYAAMLLKRAEPGDATRALEHLGHASATAERLGLPLLAERVRQRTAEAERVGSL